ncbi:tetratricopeptide repeat protein [Streptomyces sp. NPDC058195]|uniref:tetratricopeptide repeat protein n=1 Tax=Streptomyces sp. NPDC058195 TaxID=3346375 RepID=UPI0036E1C8B8
MTNAVAVSEMVTSSHDRLSCSYAKAHLRIAFATRHDAFQWLESQHRNCMAVISAAAEAGLHRQVWQLVHAMRPSWRQHRRYPDWITAHELAVRSAIECGNAKAYMVLALSLGTALRSAGSHEAARGRFSDVLEMSAVILDRRATAQALRGIGATHCAARRFADARAFLDQALRVSKENGSWREVALTDIVHARIDMFQGRHAVAVERLTAAQNLLTTAGDPYEASRARAYLSRACCLAGDTVSARKYGRAAREGFLAFLAGAPDLWSARSLEFLAFAELAARNARAAQDLMADALAEYEVLSSTDAARLRAHLLRVRATARASVPSAVPVPVGAASAPDASAAPDNGRAGAQ